MRDSRTVRRRYEEWNRGLRSNRARFEFVGLQRKLQKNDTVHTVLHLQSVQRRRDLFSRAPVLHANVPRSCGDDGAGFRVPDTTAAGGCNVYSLAHVHRERMQLTGAMRSRDVLLYRNRYPLLHRMRERR